MAVAYFQPITRARISELLGREVSRDVMAAIRAEGLIGEGPRSPKTGAAYTYVTTPGYLARFGFKSLRDLPDIDRLEDAGLLGPSAASADLNRALRIEDEEEDAA